MNAKQKKFIETKLIPFILREQGRGFAMERWLLKNATPGEVLYDDGVERTIPKCGTVACIGGSIQCLTGYRSYKTMAKEVLGITPQQTNALFYDWDPLDSEYPPRFWWPADLVVRFGKADTPHKKARVVASLLRRVIRTNGKCLEHADGY